MVIKTRYRDIPWSDIESAHGRTDARLEHPEWWEELRGKPVEVIAVPVAREELPVFTTCTQPHYAVAGGHPFRKDFKGKTLVCPHIAEIGD